MVSTVAECSLGTSSIDHLMIFSLWNSVKPFCVLSNSAMVTPREFFVIYFRQFLIQREHVDQLNRLTHCGFIYLNIYSLFLFSKIFVMEYKRFNFSNLIILGVKQDLVKDQNFLQILTFLAGWRSEL